MTIVAADGSNTVVITPASAFYGTWGANGTYLPFVQTGCATPLTPFATAGTWTQNGPFLSQFANTVTYGIDSLTVEFQNT